MDSKNKVIIKRLSGEEIARHVDDLARLRIEIFREFPYLYDGDLEYEARYVRYYLEASDSVLVAAIVPAEEPGGKDQVVGLATGMPLDEADEVFQKPFAELGFDVSRIFYFSESVLQHDYRGQGIGVAFFTEREAHVHALNRFDWMCFSAVVRSPDHPDRPADYQPLFDFWKNRGYERHPELRTTLAWKGVGHVEAVPEIMEFWLKPVTHPDR